MRALQYRAFGSWPELVEVPIPQPGPAQIRLRVTAAGICHSDLRMLSYSQDEYLEYGWKAPPLTLGHEVAGIVDQVGAGVSGVEVGEPVLVYGAWGCGRCYQCAQGIENNCLTHDHAPGANFDGGMADFMIVNDARHLVPLGSLDPAASVALTDAGMTAYRAVKHALPWLRPGSSAVVIGIGGLGHIAIQVLKALTASTVIALDIGPEPLRLARDVGADHALESGPSAISAVKTLTRGLGAEAVFDFVGVPDTTKLAGDVVATAGLAVVAGYGGGAALIGPTTVPFDVTGYAVNWGARTDLLDVVELARRGDVTVHVERFSLDEAPEAYRALQQHQIRGRAVVVP